MMTISRSSAGRLCRMLWAAVLATGLPGCGVPPVAPIEAGPTSVPEAEYRQLEAAGRPVWRLDPAVSLIVAEVGRAGPLARLGHDHVVAAHRVVGFVAPHDGRADLQVAVTDLVVDESELRTAAGFDTLPSAEAIDGTRRNMLTKVFDAERYPSVVIGIRRADPRMPELAIGVTINGVRRNYLAPAHIEAGQDKLRVSGHLTLKQSEFGIVPLAVLGGALQVRDAVDLRYDLVARPP